VKIPARVIASILIAAGAVWGAAHCYQRYSCNLREAAAQETLMKLFAIPDQVTSRIAARTTIEETTRCLQHAPASIGHYMLRAAALRMLGRYPEAAMDYRRALRIDRRAELYFNLGLTELDAGRTEQAADALTTAVFLFYPYVDEIPQPMQDRVRAAVTPTVTMIQRRRAPASVVQELGARVERDPM
jgi:tetratricopeptide (TPR) repeat protein